MCVLCVCVFVFLLLLLMLLLLLFVMLYGVVDAVADVAVYDACSSSSLH